MSKNHHSFSDVQADIFQQVQTPVEDRDEAPYDLDVTCELRGACATALKHASRNGMSRERLAEELNMWLPNLATPITKRKIDAWMAQSKEDHPIPAFVIPALCKVTKCYLPLRELAKALDLDLEDAASRRVRALGEAELERAVAARRVQEIKKGYVG